MYENTHYRDMQEAFQAGYRKAIKEQQASFGGGVGGPVQKGGFNPFGSGQINRKPPTGKEKKTEHPCPAGSVWDANGWAGAGCYSAGYFWHKGKWWTRGKDGRCYYHQCYIDPDTGEHQCTQVEAPCPAILH